MFLIDDWQITEVFDDIVLGRGVKRSVHNLRYENDILTGLFIERLRMLKYRPMHVRDIHIDVGFRMPAFYVTGNTAIFGYVFWEVFTERRKRKIWGSVVRNERGDWKYEIPANSDKIVFVNMNQKEEIDIYYLK